MTDMADFGDGSWGHLAETEHFGRACTNYILVPKADLCLPKYSGSTHAGHCLIFSRTEEKIFGIYAARAVILVRTVLSQTFFQNTLITAILL